MRHTFVTLILAATVGAGLGGCGSGLRRCSQGCPAPLFCHEPTQLCAWPDPLDSGIADAGCPTGYEEATGACTDIDECAHPGGGPCGTAAKTCTNTLGSYSCSCVSGFEADPTGGACHDIDECTTTDDNCDHEPTACVNNEGAFACTCPSGFIGNGRGESGCLLTDPRLLSLVPSNGSLSPSFAQDVSSYTLLLLPGSTSVSLTPSIPFPGHADIAVAGLPVTSGATSKELEIGLIPQPITVVVSTESGQNRVYNLVVRRALPVYLKASNTQPVSQLQLGDRFGHTIALSGDGETLAVGAYSEDSAGTGTGGASQEDNTSAESGAVYVFSRAGSTWTQQAYIKASNTGPGDVFGRAVSLSKDGATLAVGAPGEDSGSVGINGNENSEAAVDSGAVYIFVRNGTEWTQQAYIKASNTGGKGTGLFATGDAFGSSVALSGDGSTLISGAPFEGSATTGIDGDQASNGASCSGAAYVFYRTNKAWRQRSYIKASNAQGGNGGCTVSGVGDTFGMAVAVSGDGLAIAVGAPEEDSSATGVNGDQTTNDVRESGAVYVFVRSSPADAPWMQQAYVKASNTDASDGFGRSLVLSADGSILAVGASDDSSATGVNGDGSNNDARNSGAAYVFSRAGTKWTQEAYLKASNTDPEDTFGAALALSNDGQALAIGAPHESSAAMEVNGDEKDNGASGSGAVYFFSRTSGTWKQQAYVKAPNAGANDAFGHSVSLSSDGADLAVGSIGEASSATGINGDQSLNDAAGAGAVYVF